MDIVEMDFERILKTHYFLFTSSSSLCDLRYFGGFLGKIQMGSLGFDLLLLSSIEFLYWVSYFMSGYHILIFFLQICTYNDPRTYDFFLLYLFLNTQLLHLNQQFLPSMRYIVVTQTLLFVHLLNFLQRKVQMVWIFVNNNIYVFRHNKVR